MSAVTTLSFWLGGVLCESIVEITLKAGGVGDIANLDIEVYLALEVLREELALGWIDKQAYCQKFSEHLHDQLTADSLDEQIKEAFNVRSEVLEVIEALPDEYQFWVICDFPKAWFSVLEKRLYQCARLNKNNLIFTAEQHLEKLTPDIYTTLIQQVREPKEAVLTIDGDTRRAVSAVTNGFNTALFVDASHLQREFSLRRMTQRTDQMERASVVEYIRREGV